MTRPDSITLDSVRGQVIDGQSYIASTDFLPPSFVEGIAANTSLWVAAQGLDVSRARVHAACLRYFDDPWCDALVTQMDEAGIRQSVLMLADFTYAISGLKLTIAEMIAHHRAVLDRHPGRFYVMLGVDPRWGRDGVDLFERAIAENGFHGLKLYPPCGYSPSDEALWPFYEICQARGLPVSVHTGGTAMALSLDLGYPRLIDRAARTFGGVNFILSHASTCYTDECVMLCNARPNVYLDVAAFAAQPRKRLSALFEYGISHKLIFATDWPSFRGRGKQRSLLGEMFAEDGPVNHMRDFEVRRFFHGTLESLLPSNRSESRLDMPKAPNMLRRA